MVQLQSTMLCLIWYIIKSTLGVQRRKQCQYQKEVSYRTGKPLRKAYQAQVYHKAKQSYTKFNTDSKVIVYMVSRDKI